MLRPALLSLALASVLGCRHGEAPRPTGPLTTVAERSDFVRTGRYTETVTLCHDFARTYAGVSCDEIGRTLEDRPIVALHVSRGKGHPTIYFQGGIHAGEIDGKDAGFWFLRDLLDGKVAPGALDVVDLVFVPVINPDGHERISRNNRPNQRGPEEMGFRTNSVRLNVNRDFVKADTNEIRAALGVVTKYDPVVFVDLHATDGAKFEHDVAVLVSPVAPREDKLDETAHALSDQIQARMTALGHLPLSFYPSFEKDDEPTSGFAVGEAPPRFSQAYMGVRSRLGILVETHSWRPYKHRVEAMYHFLQTLFERATTDVRTWRDVERHADVADRALRGKDLALVHGNGKHATQIDFRGYAYEQKASDISGGTWIAYDETTPQIWKVPLLDELVPTVTARVPHTGYIIDGGWAAALAPVLAAHGIVTKPMPEGFYAKVQVFRASKVTFDRPFEGRTRATLEGTWTSETRSLDRGAVLVDLDQKAARLIVHLLDPAGPDSFAQWGFLNPVFERKEYMESYVAEEEARRMMTIDPSLRAKFEAALADPEFAKSPQKRLDWFYMRHPAWDEHLNAVPIYRYDER